MDIVAQLTTLMMTLIPAYFVLGPLVVILIMLIVMATKKSVPVAVSVPQVTIQEPVVAPVVQLIHTPTMQAPVPVQPQVSFTPPPVVTQATQQVEQSVQATVQIPVTPQVTPQMTSVPVPVHVVEEVKQSPPPVPPISSWKPSSPAPVSVEQVTPVIVEGQGSFTGESAKNAIAATPSSIPVEQSTPTIVPSI